MHNNRPHVIGSISKLHIYKVNLYVTVYKYRAAVAQLSSCQTYRWWPGFNCNWNHTSHWWSGI